MRILLPPSEGKRTGGTGPPLAEVGFGPAPLRAQRRRLAAAVERVAAGNRARAVGAFVLPPAVADAALAANAVLTRSPTRAALDRYAGVVYDGLDVSTLTAAQRAVADATILVFSGLFGVLSGADAIPDYRVPASTVLPRIGAVGPSWRSVLTRVLPATLGHEPVLDLRSTDYASMWRPGAAARPGVIDVRILSRRPGGSLGVISHFSKHAKGRLTRAVVERISAGETVADAAAVAKIWREVGFGAATVDTAGGRTRLELVTAD